MLGNTPIVTLFPGSLDERDTVSSFILSMRTRKGPAYSIVPTEKIAAELELVFFYPY